MDFVTGLPESGPNKFNSMLVVVDCLTKMAHYIPTHETVTSEQVARLYLYNIFRVHGLADSIISHRGTQFTSRFSRALYKLEVIT